MSLVIGGSISCMDLAMRLLTLRIMVFMSLVRTALEMASDNPLDKAGSIRRADPGSRGMISMAWSIAQASPLGSWLPDKSQFPIETSRTWETWVSFISQAPGGDSPNETPEPVALRKRSSCKASMKVSSICHIYGYSLNHWRCATIFAQKRRLDDSRRRLPSCPQGNHGQIRSD